MFSVAVGLCQQNALWAGTSAIKSVLKDNPASVNILLARCCDGENKTVKGKDREVYILQKQYCL